MRCPECRKPVLPGVPFCKCGWPEPKAPTCVASAAAPDWLAVMEYALKYLEHPDVQVLPFAISAGTVAKRMRKVIASAEGRCSRPTHPDDGPGDEPP